MTKTLPVALIQERNHADAEANLAVIEARVTEAAKRGAKLVLLQELHNGAYFCQHQNVCEFELAEAIPGPSTKRLGELAKANNIRVVLTSITPSTHFPWRPAMHPAEAIRQRNAWLKQYSASHGLVYVDFYPALANSEGGMKPDLTIDGVHPNEKGYAAMAPLVQAGIDQALGGR